MSDLPPMPSDKALIARLAGAKAALEKALAAERTAHEETKRRLEEADRYVEQFAVQLRGRPNVLDNPPSSVDLMNVLADAESSSAALRAALAQCVDALERARHHVGIAVKSVHHEHLVCALVVVDLALAARALLPEEGGT